MNYDGPAMAQQIMRLQARVKELLDSKQHEFKCFQEVNSELTEVREENARLEKEADELAEELEQSADLCAKALCVVDAAREIRKKFVASNIPLLSLFEACKRFDKEILSLAGDKKCSKCEGLGKIGPCDEHAAPGC